MNNTRTMLVVGTRTGIGRALVESLLAAGDQVWATTRDPRAMQLNHPNLRVVGVDVRDPGTLTQLREQLEARNVSLDGVVYNAGIAVTGPLPQLPPPAVASMVQVNLTGAMHLLRAVYPRVRKPGGRVLLVSSVSAIRGFPGWSVYAATKAGLVGLARALRAEWNPEGVAVEVVLPGAVDTPIWDPFLPPGEDRSWMMRAEDVAHLLVTLLHLPSSMQVEELVVTPLGIRTEEEAERA